MPPEAERRLEPEWAGPTPGGRASLGLAACTAIVVGNNPSGKSLLDASAALAPLTMFAYLVFCALAPGLIAVRTDKGSKPKITPVEIVAFVFGIFAVYGCGPQPVLFGLLLLLLGIPVYVWQRHEHATRAAAH